MMFKKLKTIMFANDVDQKRLQKELDRSQTYITARMMGRKPWSIEEIYKLCDLLEISYEQISVFFPRGGREEK